MTDPALFHCFWSKSAYGPTDISEFQIISDFTEEMGYTKEHIAAVTALEVGSTYCNHDHGLNSHIVTRVR